MKIWIALLYMVAAVCLSAPAGAEPFSERALALMLTANGDGAGKSAYSFEALPSCGTDPAKPACQLERFCPEKSFQCAPPRWSDARSAWVRVETRETALRRWQRIAERAARTAYRLVRCRDEEGSVIEKCQRAGWPEGPETLLAAGLTTAFWESGYREDIQHGYEPLGRGPGGEVCLMQIMPSELRNHAKWLPERVRAAMTTDELVAEVLGDAPEKLDHCFEAGMRALARMRGACRHKPGHWAFKMWSMYGTGGTCSFVADPGKKNFALQRYTTFHRLMASEEGVPDPIRKLLGLEPVDDRQAVR